MHYLQSAGTIGIGGGYAQGSGLEADINNSSTRLDFLSSSSIPYRAAAMHSSNKPLVGANSSFKQPGLVPLQSQGGMRIGSCSPDSLLRNHGGQSQQPAELRI